MTSTLRSSGGITSAIAASRVLGLVRESLFAALFGGGALADAYQVAFRIPNLLRDLFAEGALSSAFVPVFSAALVDGDRERAYRLGNLVLSAVLLVTGLLCAAGIVFSDAIVHAISGGFAGDQAKVRLASELARVMMPLLCLVSLGAVWMGMLNAQQRYLAPALASATFNLASIGVGLALLALVLGDAERALLWWSIGTTAAGLVQGLVQLPALWRLGYRPRLPLLGLWSDPGVRRIGRLMLPAVLGLAAVQVNIIVNTQFAGLLGDGPVAQLSYAFRVFYLPVGLFSVALATVTAVRVAKDAARADLDALRASTGEGLAAVWMLMSGSAAGLCVLAVPIVQLLFERGAFGHADTLATAAVLQAYALGLLPYGLVKVLAPVFYGLDRPRMPLFASLTAVAVNLAFNAATYQALGAPGLALGTALGALANAVVLRLGVSRAVGPLGPGAAGRLVSLLLANLLLAGAVFGLWEGLSAHLPGRGATGQLALGAALLAVVSAGFGLYVLALRRLSYPGADLLARLPGQLYRRVRGRAG